MAQRQRSDRDVLQHIGRRHRERQQIERNSAPPQAEQQDRQQQPLGDGKDHVDREPRPRVDEPCIYVGPVEVIEQRRSLARRVPAPAVEKIEPAQPVLPPDQARHAGNVARQGANQHAPRRPSLQPNANGSRRRRFSVAAVPLTTILRQSRPRRPWGTLYLFLLGRSDMSHNR